jgi:hypothetical protein
MTFLEVALWAGARLDSILILSSLRKIGTIGNASLFFLEGPLVPHLDYVLRIRAQKSEGW